MNRQVSPTSPSSVRCFSTMRFRASPLGSLISRRLSIRVSSQRSQTASSAADSSARILAICSMIPALLWRRET